MKIKEIQVTRYILVNEDETHQYGDVEFIERKSAELAMNNIKQNVADKYSLDLS